VNITLMHNPGAGSGDEQPHDLVAALAAAGHTVRYHSTKSNGWRDELAEAADLIVAAGGDGTVGRILLAMPGGAAPVTVLPSGSANNIARALGSAGHDPGDLARAWTRGAITRFDIGEVRGGGNATRFVESAGGGLFAEALVRAEGFEDEPGGEAKRRHGLKLLVAAIAATPVRRWGVTADGKDLSGEHIAVEAMNIGEIGPNLPLAPGADPGDGRLDLVLVPREARDALAAFALARIEGRAAPDLDLTIRRVRVVEFTVPEGCPFHVDDTLWPGDGRPVPASVRVTAAEGAVEVLSPGVSTPAG
jgi:diacylglycerol kinase (ATP)